MKPWILNARLELYKGMGPPPWSGVFLPGTVWDLWGVQQPPSMQFGTSPDLNPIENFWDALEQGVKGHHTAPTKLTGLWTALANICQVIPMERFQKLVESMPRRVAAAIKVT
ncbi:juvenile hormone acid O-methyltransferase [Trichonephila clavipes]|nr:juvenile hormone acid O-methyltransferase [Trichonephila clavipes]